MSKFKKFCLSLLSLLSALCLTVGIGLRFVVADDDPDIGYNDKLIVRYTLDEIVTEKVDETTTKYFLAIDKDGNPIDEKKAVTTASVAFDAMEGKGAGNFTSGSMTIPAFLDSEATGFSVSGWMINQDSDWNTIFRYGTLYAAGTSEISLPNLTYRFEGGFANIYPGADNKLNGHEWDSFKNTTDPITSNNLNEYMYVTISIDAAKGITYYKDGVKAIHYPLTTALSNAAYTINDIVTACIQAAKTQGLVFGDGNIARFDDLRISELLTDEEVAEQYSNSASLNISKIFADDAVFKEYTYDQVSAGIPYENAEYVIYYIKDFEDPDGDQNDNFEPNITFEAATLSSVNTESSYGSITPIASSDYTVEVVEESEHVTANDQTTYYKVFKLSKGDISKLIKINFVKNESEDQARKYLSTLKIDGVLIDGFSCMVNDYTYSLEPTVTQIPVVTYTAMIPEAVTLSDNKDEAFNGKQFVYEIDVSYEGTVINTYTITFTRASSAKANTLTIDSNGIYNFNNGLFYDADTQTGVQNAYVKRAITDISKVTMTTLYDTAVLDLQKSSIDPETKDITLVVRDTVSNEEKTYLIRQVEFSQDLLAKKISFGSGEGYTLKGGATDKAGYVDLGETGYIDINNFLADLDEINPDGITLTTWMRMPAASTNTWAAVMALTNSNGTILVNNNQILTGNYPLDGSWNNDGWANNSDRFKSNLYKLVALQITPGKAVLYVDGALIQVKDSRIAVSADSDIGFGRSHLATELLGSGYYKDFRVYNAPISVASINDIVAEQEASLLTSLKFEGSTANIPNFSSRSFSYEVEYSSAKTNPTANDFPKLVASNGAGAIDASKIVAGSVSGKSITYTITSEANGFSNVYTVKVTLVDNNTKIQNLSILYSGKNSDFQKELKFADFELVDGKMVATVKVWKGADLSGFVIEFALGEGQSAENEVLTETSYSVDVYAQDGSYVTYVVNFEFDNSVKNPDSSQSNLGMILGIVFGSLGGVIVIGGGVAAGIYFSKKSKKSE